MVREFLYSSRGGWKDVDGRDHVNQSLPNVCRETRVSLPLDNEISDGWAGRSRQGIAAERGDRPLLYPTGPNDSVWILSGQTPRCSKAVWISAINDTGPQIKY